MFLISFYVPESHLDFVKNALFEAGAGKYGNYDKCCWQTLGTGQFRPLEQSCPFIGTKEKVETVKEYKVELICSDDRLKNAISALKASHPYEEPAFNVIRINQDLE